jgi:NAD(P)-dependent dehydrogenase (short-subunit alcohol dehydrogenase family)
MTTLITGATRGIGRGLFEAAVQAGEPAIGTFRSAPPADLAQYGDWLPLDLRDPTGPAALARRLERHAIDLLVCNAGIYPDKGHRLEGGFPAAMWADTFAVNVTGVFLTIQALLPCLRRANTAKIAILSSQMGSSTRAPGGSYIYRASKAAVLNLGRNLAVDLAGEGIAVGIYHPGWVRTDMGGAVADIGLKDSVAGLRARFAALGPERSGCFERWDGGPLPY